MSKSVEERIVQMRFDNQRFERNVRTTMSTLDRLKQSLKLDGATRGLENVDRAAKNVSMPGLSSAVETAKNRFSALEVVAVTALANITNSVVNAGRQLVDSFTVEPIRQGFEEYELKMGAVQTIMASTGADINTVNGYLDELNTYADKTIYSFSDMTQSIGKFTNAGVSLDDAVKAIQGISNEAAVSGANTNEASRAMYNFAQALSAGSVKLIDWKSIENANMATVEFKQSLIDTALAMGTVVKVGDHYKSTTKDNKGGIAEAFTATSMFNDSLSAQWMTTEVLVQTLGNYATDIREMSAEEKKAYEEKLRGIGYTEEQIKAIEKLGQKAFDSAQDVKTFSQLMDTLKEAAGSGWAQTFEILFGDLEEAKKLWTGVSTVVGGFIDKTSKARNDLLQGWKDLGGRKQLIASFKNAFDGLVSVVRPVSKGFREMFPATTAEQLYGMTVSLKKFTSHLKLGKEDAINLKRTFKGVFAVLDLGKQAIGAFVTALFPMAKGVGSVGSGILAVTGRFGKWLVAVDKAAKKSQVFNNAVQKIHDAVAPAMQSVADHVHGAVSAIEERIPGAVAAVRDFANAIKEKAQTRFSPFEKMEAGAKTAIGKLMEFFQASVPTLTRIGGIITDTLGKIGDGIRKAVHGEGFDSLIDLLNGGMMVGIGAGIMKFIKNANDVIGESGGIVENIQDILGGAKDALSDFQASLKAGTLMKIAQAIAILAASLLVLSLIDSDRLGGALAAISILFGELSASMAVFDRTLVNKKSLMGMGVTMVEMSAAILILSGALKKIADIEPDRLSGALTGITVLLGEMVVASIALSKWGGKGKTGAVGILLFAGTIHILAGAVKKISELEPDKLTQGLTGVGILLAELSAFLLAAKFGGFNASQGLGIVALAGALLILEKAVSGFGEMEPKAMGQGLLGVATALMSIAAAMNLMPKNTVGIGVGLLAVAGALKLIDLVIGDFGKMNPDEIKKGIGVLAGSMTILAVALRVMKGTLSGAAAMLVVSAALAVFVPILKALGSMSLSEIGKGLLALAGAFTILGIAGAVLGPLVSVILGLSAAVALLGVGVAACGAGILAFSAGLAALAVSGTAGVAALIACFEILIVGIIGVIARSVEELANAVKAIVLALVDTIVSCVPALVEGVLTLVEEVLKSLSEHAPTIVTYLADFLIGVMNALAAKLPELIATGAKLIGTFFKGIFDVFKGADADALKEGLLAAGALTALMFALSAVAGLIPGAMIGVLGIGAVVGEMALVLAAIGALAQIPGLEWLIGEGGDLLQKIGSAIGKFVGGLLGGIVSGATGQLTQIGNDLSVFIKSIQPFIKDASKINAGSMAGVKSIAEIILTLTKANVLDGISKWITGSSSLLKFGEELAAFGPYLKGYADSVRGLDGGVVSNSANAAKALAEMAKNLPNSGGVAGWFAGNNDIGAFGEGLKSFGKSLSDYYRSVSGINTSRLNGIVAVLLRLADFANKVSAAGVSGMSRFVKSLGDMGADGIDALIRVFTDADARITRAFTAMLARAVAEIQNEQAAFRSAGAYLVDGFVRGISENTYKAQAQAKAMADAADQAARNELGVKSPSKVFAEIGGYVVDGFARGIGKNKGKAAKSAGDMAAVGVRAANEVLKSLNSGNSIFSEFVEKTDKKGKAVKLTLEKAAEAFKSFRNSVKDSVKGATGAFDEFKVETDVTGKQLLKNLKSQITGIKGWAADIRKLAGRGVTDAMLKMLSDMGPSGAKYTAALAAMTDKELREFNSLYKRRLSLNGKAADEIASSFLSGGKKAISAYKEGVLNSTVKIDDIAKAVRASLKKGGSVFAEFAENADKNGKAVAVTLKEAAEAFRSFRDSVKDSVKDATGVFDAFESETDITGKQILKNLRSQIAGIKDWADNVQILAARGMNKGLLKALSDMGPSGAKYASALVSMTDTELKKVNSLYKQRLSLNDKTADQIASSFLKGGQKAAGAYGTGVLNPTLKFWEKAESSGARAAAGMVNGISDKLNEAFGWNYQDAVKEMKAGLAYGKGVFQQFANAYLKSTKDITLGNKAIRAASKAITAYGRKLYEESDYYKEDTANLKAHKKELKSLQNEREKLQKQLKNAQKSNTAASKARVKALKKELETNQNAITAAKKQVMKDEDEIAKHTKEVFNNLRSTVSESVSSFLDPLRVSLESGVDLFKKFESNSQLYEADKKNLEGHKQSLAELEKTQKSILDEMSLYADKNTIAARKRVKELNAQLSEVESRMEEAKQNIAQTEEDMASHSEVTVNSILENMNSQVEGVRKWQQDMQTLAAKGLSQGLLDKLKEMGTDGVDYVDQFMKMTADEIGRANELFAQTESLASQTLVNNFRDSLNAAKDWSAGMQKLAQMGFGQELLEKLGDMGVDGYDYVKAFLTMTPEQVEQFNKDFADSLKLPNTVADQVISSYAYAGGQSVAGFTEALKKLGESGTEENAELVATADKIGEVLWERLETGSKQAGRDSVDALVKGLFSEKKTAKDGSKELGGAALTALKGVLSQKAGTAVAGNIVSGLAAGLLDGSSKISEAARQAATAAYRSAKNALGIKSPSRKFAELGRYVDAGFVQGLTSGESGIRNTAADIMGRAIREVSDILGSEMDAQPTIRPVMDLTEIQNGFASIGKMADASALSGSVGLAGMAALDMGRRSVPTDDAALCAIQKLQDTLAGIMDRPGIEQNNTFSITGNDPRAIADEISKILQRQVERRSTVWA